MLWLRFFARPFIAPPKVEPILTEVFTSATVIALGVSEGRSVVTGLAASIGSSTGTSTVIGIFQNEAVGFAAGEATVTGIGISVNLITTARDILHDPVDFILAGNIVEERPPRVASAVARHIFNE